MTMPMPPGYEKPEETTKLEIKEIKEHPISKRVKGLTDLDKFEILERNLRPEHRKNATVLAFIDMYLQCRDARQVAKELGLKPGQGTFLKTRPDIWATIQELTDRAILKFGFDQDEVVEKVKEIAFVDPAELQNEDGSYKKSMTDLSPEFRRAIKKFKVKNIYEKDPNGMDIVVGEIIEVELWDKMKAVELLGREKDLFKETTKVQHDVTSNMKDILLDSKRRALERTEKVIDVPADTPNRVIDVTGERRE